MDKPEQTKQASRVLDFAKIVIAGLIGAAGGSFKEDPWMAFGAFISILVFAGFTIMVHKWRCLRKKTNKTIEDVGVK